MKITVSHDAVTSHRLRRITLKLMLLGKTFKTQGETNCCRRHHHRHIDRVVVWQCCAA